MTARPLIPLKSFCNESQTHTALWFIQFLLVLTIEWKKKWIHFEFEFPNDSSYLILSSLSLSFYSAVFLIFPLLFFSNSLYSHSSFFLFAALRIPCRVFHQIQFHGEFVESKNSEILKESTTTSDKQCVCTWRVRTNDLSNRLDSCPKSAYARLYASYVIVMGVKSVDYSMEYNCLRIFISVHE